VEKNRSKFPLIKDGELANRKKFVDDMEAIIQGKVNHLGLNTKSAICFDSS
jgi:hypothetical protein